MLSGFFFSKSPMVKLMRYLSIVSVLIYLTTNTSCFMTLRNSMYQQVTCLIIVSNKLMSGIETHVSIGFDISVTRGCDDNFLLLLGKLST